MTKVLSLSLLMLSLTSFAESCALNIKESNRREINAVLSSSEIPSNALFKSLERNSNELTVSFHFAGLKNIKTFSVETSDSDCSISVNLLSSEVIGRE